MAQLNYVTQNEKSISIEFNGLPADSALFFVNVLTGAQTASKSAALAKGGKGSATIPIEKGLGVGAFCLTALTKDKTPEFIAQTVVFYLHAALFRTQSPVANTSKIKLKEK